MWTAHENTDLGSVLRGYLSKMDARITECETGATAEASAPMQKAIYRAVAGHLKHSREHLRNAISACEARK